jgi:ABC-type multidrug transport system permease subunit
VTHLIEASAELEHLYHNRALHSSSSSIEILFARFAWTIFPLLKAFLTFRKRRRLLLTDENATLFDKDGFVS